MTQRIFDIENKKDMQDLWDIFPDEVNKIEKYPDRAISPFAGFCAPSIPMMCRSLIRINWHDKTEITRPVEYESMKGCVGWFWNGEERPHRPTLSVLWKVDGDIFWTVKDAWFEHFTPAKKSELKFFEDK